LLKRKALKMVDSSRLPPEQLRIGFATMLKVTSSSKTYFDVNNREHLAFACKMYLDSLQNSATSLVDDDGVEILAKELVDWAVANPNAPTDTEPDNMNKRNSLLVSLHLKRKPKKKPTQVGSVIQHLNKVNKSQPKGTQNEATGGKPGFGFTVFRTVVPFHLGLVKRKFSLTRSLFSL
jgi:hypothetical protein